jgi:Flp pilus assembly protein TadG
MTVRATGLGRGILGDIRGVAAVEFALLAPALILVSLGSYEVFQAAAAYRKLCSTTVELAGVTSQYSTMSANDVSNVMNASAQIMTPFATQNLSIVLTEITTDNSKKPTVTWSQAYNGGTALTPGASASLPASLAQKNTSYILVQTAYAWSPMVSGGPIGSIQMTDQIYSLPRGSGTIPYTG